MKDLTLAEEMVLLADYRFGSKMPNPFLRCSLEMITRNSP